MGDSEESVFWDEKEYGYGGTLMPGNFQSNQSFEPPIQNIYDEDSCSKRNSLSPDSNQQEGDADSCSQTSPLGLTLRKTPSFLSLLQRSLSKGKHAGSSSQTDQSSFRDKPAGPKMDDLRSQSMSEKLKASNFPAIFIKIGSWQRITRHEGDLTAKLYYAKRKLVWEVLDGALKSKIEIQWSDISAIRAFTPDNEPGTLEIELNQPPMFYREINPQPRKHTLWQQSSDFTGGQAPIWRRHCVRFPPGILDKHYEKLLQCDRRLLALSQKPFPIHSSPYFEPSMFGISQVNLSFGGYGSGYLPGVPYPYQTYPTTATPPPLGLTPNPSISGVDFPFRNEGGSNNQLVAQLPTSWDQGNQGFHAQYHQSNVGLSNDFESHLLEESHVVSSDHGKVEPINSSLEANVNPSYDARYSGADYGFGGTSVEQGMQNARNISPAVIDGLYSQHVNWLPPQQSNVAMNNSIPPYLFPSNPNAGHFY